MSELLTSRKFWVTLISAVAMVVLQATGHSLDPEVLGGYLATTFAYVFSIVLDPGQGYKGLLKSRKFWAMLTGFVLMVLQSFNVIPPDWVTPEVVSGVLALIAGYIFSVGVLDRMNMRK